MQTVALQAATALKELGLDNPRDRNGKVIREKYATPELEAALEGYRAACANAHDAVREQLVLLAEQLEVGGRAERAVDAL